MTRIDRQAMGVLGSLGRAFEGGPAAASSERQLLDRFLDRRDEAAFAALVARHGPMVLGTCRALLGDRSDADDAFQATFLVLARRAGSVRPGDPLGPWLHGVARRVALRAGLDAARRRRREGPSPDLDPAAPDRPSRDAERRELAALLHAELGRLSAPERSAVTLCDLEGLTHQEAADQLGWPLGTVKSRVARGRDRLRSRLIRRGVALAPPALVAALGAEASAAAVAASGLADGTARAALAVAGGQAVAAGLASIPAYTLSRGVARTMIASKLKLLTLGLAATTGVVAVPVVATQAPAPAGARPPEARPADARDVTTKTVDAAKPAVVSEEPPIDLRDERIFAKLERPFAAPEFGHNPTLREYLDALHLDAPEPERGLPEGIPIAWKGVAEALAGDKAYAIDVRWPIPPGNLRGILTRAASQLHLDYRVEGGRLVFENPEYLPAPRPAASAPTGQVASRPARPQPAPSQDASAPVGLAAPGLSAPTPRRAPFAVRPAPARPNQPPQDDGIPPVPNNGRSPFNAELAEAPPNPGPGDARPPVLEDATEPVIADLAVAPPVQPPPAAPPSPREVDDAKRNEAILARLDQPVPLHFTTKVSLNALVEFVKKNTAKPGEKPIPIFVDQRIFGANEAGAMSSMMGGMRSPSMGGMRGPSPNAGDEPAILVDLEDVPLRASLRLALRQVGLDYVVADGILIIGRSTSLGELAAPPGKMTGPMGGMGGMM